MPFAKVFILKMFSVNSIFSSSKPNITFIEPAVPPLLIELKAIVFFRLLSLPFRPYSQSFVTS